MTSLVSDDPPADSPPPPPTSTSDPGESTPETVENPSQDASASASTKSSREDRTTDPTNTASTSNATTTGSFDCNICLDSAQDAVVSMCGHLFCWPCLHRWMETAESRRLCPVCKASISRQKVIPLYGRGGDHTQDPRTKVPPRPQGQRPEPDSSNGGGVGFGNVFNGVFGPPHDNGGGNNFRMSVGIGAFPFGFFGTTFNFGGGPSNENDANGQPRAPGENPDMNTVSTLCLFVAIVAIIWLLIA